MVLSMPKVNLQIRLPSEVDEEISKLAPASKSSFVRQAIREKIQRDLFQKLEEEWIKALKRNPEDAGEAETWLKAESWDAP